MKSSLREASSLILKTWVFLKWVQEKKPSRALIFSLWVFGVSFLSKILYTAFHNRLAQDDFCFLGAVRQHGFWGAQLHWYQNWQGRWSSTLLTTGVAHLVREDGVLFVYTAATFLALGGGLCFFLTRLFFRLYPELPSRLALVGVSFLMSYLLYGSTYRESESWHWLCASANYGWPIILALYASGLLLKEKLSFVEIGFASILFFIIVGAAEMVAALAIATLAFLTVLHWRSPARRKYGLPFLACLLSFIVVVLSPGNSIRSAIFHYDASFLHSFRVSLESTTATILEISFSKKYWFLGGLFFWVVFPTWVFPVKKSPENFIKRILTRFILAAAVTFLGCYITLAPSAFLVGAHAPTRIWVLCSALLLAFFSYAGFLISRQEFLKPSWIQGVGSFLLPPLLLVLSGYQLSLLQRSVSELSAYSSAYDSWFSLLKKMQTEGRQEIFLSSPLPSTSYFPITDLGPTQSWVSDCVRDGLGLSFEVRMKAR